MVASPSSSKSERVIITAPMLSPGSGVSKKPRVAPKETSSPDSSSTESPLNMKSRSTPLSRGKKWRMTWARMYSTLPVTPTASQGSGCQATARLAAPVT